ncbi:hypothetical protein F3Y22_tig00003725pilonHSYRG00073 [Hibiscus syriacus]|uniref:non-specific serine/threonine protein kinase n=1 Tax=Hibiscus syriacus TaxID=106335 RepID=A0A6A3CPQ3_HIBSY|nr:hypothetical protein F3Y22_tig00003725pilonHSYRG00073 [Hibiscus syriacus]
MELSLGQRSTTSSLEKVVVAVKAERVISKTALAWALTHVVRPGDCVTLLAIFPGERKGKRFWNFSMLTGDCGSNIMEELPERICQISESCSQMVLQFHNQIEVTVRIKVVSGTTCSSVAAEAKNNGANWVILDKKLKQELKQCMDELHCNIVVMKGSQPKVLRLNLQCIDELRTPFFSAASSPVMDSGGHLGHRMKHSTPVSSPEEPSTSYSRTSQEGLLPNSDSATSLFLVYQENPLFEGMNRGNYSFVDKMNNLDNQLALIDSHGEKLINLSVNSTSSVKSNDKSIFWIPQNHNDEKPGKTLSNRVIPSSSKSLLDKFVQYDRDGKEGRLVNQSHDKDYMVSSNIRDAVALGARGATDGFAEVNFLAEGVFGVVYRGILRDGQFVAVKLLKFIGCQADIDFCRELHLVDRSGRGSLDWQSRLRIAIGAARGLRYLHEDCRVGCIVHRDMRPENILLTHDFEPQVTDFGLARWHSGQWIGNEDRTIGTSGYLAPEYLDGGRITQKVDVYAFGVVLLELMTGQRINDLKYYKGQNFLSDWFHPLAALNPNQIITNIYQLIDPCLAPSKVQDYTHQFQAMGRAAFLCLNHDPESRPPMSKILGMLEGGDTSIPLSLDLNSIGNRSGHLRGLKTQTQPESRRLHSRKLSH